MWWKLLILIVMAVMIMFSFIEPAPQKIIGEASRIFYYHIPQAWISVIAFAMSMIYSIRFLKKRSLDEDDKAAATAGLGFMFCLLAAVTGAIFAKVTWGSFWNWDPRETSIFILLLIYGAYFALRGAIAEDEKRAALSAVYAIFAFITVPFLIFVVPRIVPSLHPSDSIVNEDMKFTMGPSVRTIFFSSLIVFTAVYFWLFNITRRALKIKRHLLNEDK